MLACERRHLRLSRFAPPIRYSVCSYQESNVSHNLKSCVTRHFPNANGLIISVNKPGMNTALLVEIEKNRANVEKRPDQRGSLNVTRVFPGVFEEISHLTLDDFAVYLRCQQTQMLLWRSEAARTTSGTSKIYWDKELLVQSIKADTR